MTQDAATYWCMFGGVLLIIGGASLPKPLTLVSLGLVVLFLGAMVMPWRVLVGSDGVGYRSLLGGRFISFANLVSVEARKDGVHLTSKTDSVVLRHGWRRYEEELARCIRQRLGEYTLEVDASTLEIARRRHPFREHSTLMEPLLHPCTPSADRAESARRLVEQSPKSETTVRLLSALAESTVEPELRATFDAVTKTASHV
jgi:hypothetical protein